MNNIFDHIRYGSAIFMYLSSSFLTLNVFLSKCTDIFSLLFFLISAIIIFTFIILCRSERKKTKVLQVLEEVFIVTAVTFSMIYELSKVLVVFRSSSDNASTVPGTYVFSLVIVFSALICSKSGGDALIKLSNIIFIVPLISLIISAFGIFTSGITTEIISYTSESVVASMLNGTVSAALMLSDIYIIIYMLKAEKCYNYNVSKSVFIFSVILILFFAFIYRMMFGIEIGGKLYAPAISASGLINGFDFEEIYLLAYSVCHLFRAACRINILSTMINKLIKRKVTEQAAIYICLLTISAMSAYITLSNVSERLTELIISVIFILAFMVLPLCGRKSPKNTKQSHFVTK